MHPALWEEPEVSRHDRRVKVASCDRRIARRADTVGSAVLQGEQPIAVDALIGSRKREKRSERMEIGRE